MTLLQLQNISKNYHSNIGSFDVFKEINFEINENENIFLFGPSGCGKSSLLNIISGLDKPDGGEISFLNKKLSNHHHDFLKNDLKITTPEIDDMIEIASKFGSIGSKIVGSGGGGSIVCLSKNRSASLKIVNELKNYGVKDAFIANLGKGPTINYE